MNNNSISTIFEIIYQIEFIDIPDLLALLDHYKQIDKLDKLNNCIFGINYILFRRYNYLIR